MRRSTPCGCSPCTSSRLATRSSSVNVSASTGSAADGHPQHPLEAGPVEVGYLTDQLLGALARGSAARRAGVEQRLYPIARRAPLRVILGFVRAMRP